LKHKALRLPDELSEEVSRRARIKGVPDTEVHPSIDRAGLLLESMKMAMEKPVPSAVAGLCEEVFEIRNLV
jgi:hypothetical protein